MGFGDLVNKAKDLAADHKDAVEGAIDKAGDMVDEKTDGKFSGMVDKAQGVVKSQLTQAE